MSDITNSTTPEEHTTVTNTTQEEEEEVATPVVAEEEEVPTSNNPTTDNASSKEGNNNKKVHILIAGGGIVGLTLALALKKHCGDATNIEIEIYEQAKCFYDDVGAGLGMYPNGLRVIRDISNELLQNLRNVSVPYEYRKWMKHDGSIIAEANENVLTNNEIELSSIGIRRWQLQKVLYEYAIQHENIKFYFNKYIQNVITLDNNNTVQVIFQDGTTKITNILFGSDGAHSKVRNVVAGNVTSFHYTGITCLMGISKTSTTGISFPSSITSNCHAVYFPTGHNEQCFQIHTNIQESQSNPNNWGNLDNELTQNECNQIIKMMEHDGWDDQFIRPMKDGNVIKAVKVGFALLEPKLNKWVYGKNGNVILLGDAAHPPVPYVGQGAQQGIEDAGTIAILLKRLCINDDNNVFNMDKFTLAMELYEKIRIPRSGEILECSKSLGAMQHLRATADSQKSELLDTLIQGEVLLDDTLGVMFAGADHNYLDDIDMVLSEINGTKKIADTPWSTEEEYDEYMNQVGAYYATTTTTPVKYYNTINNNKHNNGTSTPSTQSDTYHNSNDFFHSEAEFEEFMEKIGIC